MTRLEIDFRRALKESYGPKYDVVVRPVDGNAFSVLGAVSKALRRAGASSEEVKEFMDEATSGDYDNLLRVAMKWVNLEP